MRLRAPSVLEQEMEDEELGVSTLLVAHHREPSHREVVASLASTGSTSQLSPNAALAGRKRRGFLDALPPRSAANSILLPLAQPARQSTQLFLKSLSTRIRLRPAAWANT